MTRVALDAMGGDNAPSEIVLGGVQAAVSLKDVHVILVGDKATIEGLLAKNSLADEAMKAGRLSVVHASQAVEMDESPVNAVRHKNDCSINVAMRLVKNGQADAFVSAGNSGAVATSAILNLGRIKGVARPAIAAILPTRIPRRPILLLDAGANMDCHPDWLAQFAIMGDVYSRSVLHRTDPKTGLVSIGTEDCKGNELVHATFPLIKSIEDVDFVGNIEGHDLFEGKTDVAVCDGFVGNVILKTAESLAHAITYSLKRECKRGFFRMLGAMLLKGGFKALKRQLDPDIYGGAPLLGVPGAVIITHGASTHKAIYWAVKAGQAAACNNMTGEIARRITEFEAKKKTAEAEATVATNEVSKTA